MRLLSLELKRVLKTRLTKILLLLAVLFSVVLAYVPTTFVYYVEDGTVLTGVKAINRKREAAAPYSGELTTDKLAAAIKTTQTALSENGTDEVFLLPSEIYRNIYAPIDPIVSGIRQTYSDPVTSISPSLLSIDTDALETYYDDCDSHLKETVSAQYSKETVLSDAVNRYSKVKKPFLFYSGITSEAIEYECLLIFVLLLIAAVIAAPVFTSDYQTEADSILRCTKYGRTPLAAAKIISTLIICVSVLGIGGCIWMVVTNCLFGWESLKTSVQALFYPTSLVSWNIGQLQWGLLLSEILSMIAVICLILFLSSRCRNQIVILTASIFLCICPSFMSSILPAGIADWFGCIWPSAGMALQESVLYDFIGYDIHYLGAGSFAMWRPCMVALFAVVEIVLFIILAIRSYNKYTV